MTGKPLSAPQSSGPLSWLLTSDHRRLAWLYLVAVATCLAVAGVLALVGRVEQFAPSSDLLSPVGYRQVFALHGMMMLWLVVVPAIPGVLANALLPSRLGASAFVFPRVNRLAFQLYVIGAALLVATRGEGAAALARVLADPARALALREQAVTVAGLMAVGASSWLMALNIAVTIGRHRGRAGAARSPLVWGLAAGAISRLGIGAVGFASVLVGLGTTMESVRDLGWSIDGHAAFVRHLGWPTADAAAYTLTLPAMGVAAEIVARHLEPLTERDYRTVRAVAIALAAIVGLGWFAYGVWLAIPPTHAMAAVFASQFAFLMAVPIGAFLVALVVASRGAVAPAEPGYAFALAFASFLLIGTLSGLFCAALSLGVHLRGTTFAVAHLHYVLMGGTVVAWLGGLYQFWPQIAGRRASATLGRIACVVIVVGFHLAYFSQFILGARGMPRGLGRYDHVSGALLDGLRPWHQVSTLGAAVLGVGLVVAAMGLVLGRRVDPAS